MLKMSQLGMGVRSSSKWNIQMGVIDVYCPSLQHMGKQSPHREATWPPPSW